MWFESIVTNSKLIEYLFTTLHRNGIMLSSTRYVFWTGCAIALILACIVAGCTSNQSTSKPQVTTQPTQIISQAPLGETNSITIEKFSFNPAILTVKPGTIVTWTNRDGVDHTIVSDSGSTTQFTSEKLSNGAAYTFTFNQAGTFAYHCSIHPSMKGTIVVQ